MILVGQRGIVCHPREDLHCWLHTLCSLPGLRYFNSAWCDLPQLHDIFYSIFKAFYYIYVSRHTYMFPQLRGKFSLDFIILSVLCGLDCLRWLCGVDG
jgi:hypothetical protein